MLHTRTGGRFMSFVTKAAMVGIVLTATTIRPAWAELSPPPVQPALDQAIEQYIRSHPEVIVQALQSLELKRQEEERLRVTQAIATNEKELLEDPASPVSGNVVDGGVTVIEFFDYRCGYCKRVAGTVTQLQKDEPGVRVVYKNLPILGDASVFAARAALAAQEQGKHQAFHEAMLATENELTREEVFIIAERVGLDAKKLEADMHLPDGNAQLIAIVIWPDNSVFPEHRGLSWARNYNLVPLSDEPQEPRSTGEDDALGTRKIDHRSREIRVHSSRDVWPSVGVSGQPSSPHWKILSLTLFHHFIP